MDKFLYAIFGVAGSNPKKYKVKRVRVKAEDKNQIAVIDGKSCLIIEKSKNSLFETRKEANEYIKKFLTEK